jgi:protein-tyrosine phosphatase
VREWLTRLRRSATRLIGRAPPERLAARRVLFVCMGNICRSPTAEGVFRKLVAERAPDLDVQIDSAGTHSYHEGEPPDPRARRAAERRGVDLNGLRARKVIPEDFAHFELVLAMDEQNRRYLLEECPPEYRERVKLLLEFAPHLPRREVPDPYYGGSTGFEYVLDLVEAAGIGLLDHLRGLPPPAALAPRAARAADDASERCS